MSLLAALVIAAAQAAAPEQSGIDRPAPRTVLGSPATYDLAGFRLGMSEADIDQILRQRKMTVVRSLRTKSFESQVRDLVNLRGGRLPPGGDAVLDNVEVNDGRGGRVMIRMLAWPAGARIRSIAYLPPAGTSTTTWHDLLVARYGPSSRDSVSSAAQPLHLVWCGQQSCGGAVEPFQMVADVDSAGGQIVLTQPEGSARLLATLIENAAAGRLKVQPPSF